MGEVSGLSSMVNVSLGFGFYLILLGFIVSIAGLVYGNFIMKKVKQPVNNVAMNQAQPVNNEMNQQPVNNMANQMPVQNPELVSEPAQKFCSNCGSKQNRLYLYFKFKSLSQLGI
jgi:hypothetical protein